ncbi:MAG: MlaD family protein [Planctomycetes bacterium]|nr:MlaD family protein [Planctomycetota bacterium]
MHSSKYLLLGVFFIAVVTTAAFVIIKLGVSISQSKYSDRIDVLFERVEGLRDGDKVLLAGYQVGIVDTIGVADESEVLSGGRDIVGGDQAPVPDANGDGLEAIRVTLAMMPDIIKSADADVRRKWKMKHQFVIRNENLFGVKYIDISPIVPYDETKEANRYEIVMNEETGKQQTMKLWFGNDVELKEDGKLEFHGNLYGECVSYKIEGSQYVAEFRMIQNLEVRSQYKFVAQTDGLYGTDMKVSVLTPIDINSMPDPNRKTVLSFSEPNIGMVLEEVQLAFHEFRVLGARLNDPAAGFLPTLLSDPNLTDDANDIVESLRTTIDNIEAASDNLTQIVEDVKNATSEESGALLGRVMHDDEWGTEIGDVIDNVKTFSDDMVNSLELTENEDGTVEGSIVARLLKDDKLGEQFQEIANDVSKVMDELASERSTLGLLINDDLIYNELRNLLKNMNASIEDVRELAPITTFTGILFQAFQ